MSHPHSSTNVPAGKTTESIAPYERTEDRAWPPVGRFAFRALLIYFLLLISRSPHKIHIPFLSPWIYAAWRKIAPWVGEHILDIQGEMYLGFAGSGDRTFDYTQVFICAVIAAVGAAIWSLLDRKPRAHRTTARWLVVVCRYYLGITMLTYGLTKVIKTQFPFPSLERLVTLYGDLAPMRLLWTYMGYSAPYTIFVGFGEIVGGLLMFFNRTRTIGAAVLIAVLGNIVVINFSYGVPAKLYSVHLFLMALAILMLDVRRLIGVFLLNRPTPPADLRPLFATRWMNVTGKLLGMGLVAWKLYTIVPSIWSHYHEFGDGRERPPLWGVHEVESFVHDGDPLPPLLDDPVRWRGLIIDHPLSTGEFPGRVAIWHMDGSIERYPIELDVDGQTMTFLSQDVTTLSDGSRVREPVDVLRFERPSPDELLLQGTWQGKDVEIRLRERDLPLIQHEFHWIQERPPGR